jgi:CO dehydrogenase nickel-insertion accessory protein CooC1
VSERFVVLGLASPRAPWFAQVTRWATAGSAPIDFVKCVSSEEIHARLASGRVVSAVIVDAERAANDRDLIDRARRDAGAVFVVADARIERDWPAMGVAAVLSPDFSRDELLTALVAHAVAVGRIEHREVAAVEQIPASWRGRLLAVTGAPGTGASTIAMALAQGIATDARNRALVLLADLALDADLAMLHDARDVVPGLQELVEASRSTVPSDELARLVFTVADRGYDLLLGLRRHRDWTVVRPRSFDVALDALRRRYRVVVADVDSDIEGEEETGSADVGDRNHIARRTLRSADLVLVVGNATVKGVHSLARTLHELRSGGIAPDRLVPVVNRAGRAPRQRGELTRTLRSLGAMRDAVVDAPIFVSERRHLDDAVVHAAPFPAAFAHAIALAVEGLLDRTGTRPAREAEPAAVVPGTLGSYYEPEGAA